jgi:hypothetical protein
MKCTVKTKINEWVGALYKRKSGCRFTLLQFLPALESFAAWSIGGREHAGARTWRLAAQGRAALAAALFVPSQLCDTSGNRFFRPIGSIR